MTQNEILIKPKQHWTFIEIDEIWRFRGLFYIFAWRDIKVRYKQTFLGIAWVIFQPLLSTGIFTIFFGKLAQIPSEGMPYELFVFIGLVFWIFFSNSLSLASNSLIENANILKKVYFPKEILPIAAVVTSLADFLINFILLLIVSLFFGYIPSPFGLILIPLCILITLLTASGLGFFLASLNVKYRDVRYILPFFIQILLFLTPVIYPSSIVRDSLRYFFALNPMTGVIETVRGVFNGTSSYDLPMLTISFTSALFIFIIGIIYFRKTERFFADLV